jgi:hypothetical protein
MCKFAFLFCDFFVTEAVGNYGISLPEASSLAHPGGTLEAWQDSDVEVGPWGWLIIISWQSQLHVACKSVDRVALM